MSAYTDAVKATTPYYYWKLNETSGTTFADDGWIANRTPPAPQPLTKNGSPSLGVPSLLPGDPTNTAVAQTQDVHMAARAHNALLDQPNAPGKKLALGIWARPDTLEPGGSQVLFSKPNTYQLLFVGTSARFDTGNTVGGQMGGPGDLVIPGTVAFWVAVWDGIANTQTLYRNGVQVASRSWDEGATMPWTDASAFLVGGFNSFGTNGFQGALQHATVWIDNVPSLDQIRELYRIGATSPAEAAGQGAIVLPWSRSVLARNDDAKRRIVTNEGTEKVYLCKGPTATVRGGIPLLPGDFWESPPRYSYGPVYTGELSAVHAATHGTQHLAIDEQT